MSEAKTRKILNILRTTPGIVSAKPIGQELRFDYVFGDLHFPVVDPRLMSDMDSNWCGKTKYWWEYHFYDYANLAKNIFYELVKGEAYVNVNSCLIMPYNRITVPKLPQFLEAQMERFRKVIKEIEQRKIMKILDNLQ